MSMTAAAAAGFEILQDTQLINPDSSTVPSFNVGIDARQRRPPTPAYPNLGCFPVLIRWASNFPEACWKGRLFPPRCFIEPPCPGNLTKKLHTSSEGTTTTSASGVALNTSCCMYCGAASGRKSCLQTASVPVGSMAPLDGRPASNDAAPWVMAHGLAIIPPGPRYVRSTVGCWFVPPHATEALLATGLWEGLWPAVVGSEDVHPEKLRRAWNHWAVDRPALPADWARGSRGV